MTRPSVPDDWPWRSERARSLGAYPSAAIALSTRSAVSAATPASSLMTRETVFRLTPALRATSRIVGRVDRTPSPLDDNVVTTLRRQRTPRRGRCQGATDLAVSRWSRRAQGAGALAVQLAGRGRLYARCGGRDSRSRGGEQRLSALERGGQRGRQDVARPDRVAHLVDRGRRQPLGLRAGPGDRGAGLGGCHR